ncbi:MAG TPA: type VI secretion system baseplate subunit TssG [Aridibacter sp.]|nr:type VI secretion system baseplate subunit TssG [Aridibacter sp.]
MWDERPLDKVLFEEPYRFGFFQAVRLVQRLKSEKKSVGRDAMPHEEALRFRSHVSLNFPASEVQEIRENFDEAAGIDTLEMLVNFIGVIGVSGVLPIHYTEHALDRNRYGDTAFWAFTDIFTHRAASQFFRAWEKYRFPYSYERGDDEFTQYLFDLNGLGTKGLRGRMNLEDEALLPYSGLITQKPHSARSVAQMVSDYFGIEVRIFQFFGQWFDLDKQSITKLGEANSHLGVDAIIGSRVWDQQSKFRLVLGPLTFLRFQAFLPNGSAYEALRSLVKFMVGLEFDFDALLVLRKDQVPGMVLTTRAKRRPMLGWTSWLKSRPFEEDDRQVISRF